MKKMLLSLALPLFILPTVALAQAEAPVYGTLAFGAARANINANDINAGLRSDGLFPSSTTVENSDKAYRIGVGYRVAPSFALELYYADVGSYGSQSVASITPTSGRIDISAAYQSAGVGIDAVFGAPIAQGLSVFGRVGVLRAKTEGTFSLTGSPSFRIPNGSVSKTGNVVGMGLKYDISKQLGLAFEAQRYAKLGDDSTGGELRVNVYSLGATFNF